MAVSASAVARGSRARPRVVVAGMGDTGLLVSVQLAGCCDVVGVATRPALVSGQELGTRLGDLDAWRRNYFLPFDRFRRLDRVQVRHGRIAAVDPERHEVRVEQADGTEVVEPYDALVIATGVRNGFWRHDRVEDLATVEAGLADVQARLDAAGTIAIVGGGATGASAAVNLARRHPDKDVHLFFGRDEPLPDYHPRVRRRIARELRVAGVQVHPGHRAVVPDGFTGDRLTTGPITWTTGQPPFTADVTMWALGRVQPNSGFLPDDLLDDDGFVRVDEHLRVPGTGDVFAVGDVAATDPNRSSARNWGFLVVAHNVRAVLGGREDRLKAFRAPEHRWGSILGPQPDGLVVFQPNGRTFRVPHRAVQPLLFDLYLNLGMYRGLRPPPPR